MLNGALVLIYFLKGVISAGRSSEEIDLFDCNFLPTKVIMKRFVEKVVHIIL